MWFELVDDDWKLMCIVLWKLLIFLVEVVVKVEEICGMELLVMFEVKVFLVCRVGFDDVVW